MKVSKMVKGAVVATFAVLVIAGGAFAHNWGNCIGDGHQYPNISESPDGYPVKCPPVKDPTTDPSEPAYVTFYAKSSQDCAAVSTFTSNPDGCTGNDLNTMIRTVINAIVFIVGMVAVVMIILGGVNYATSQGDAGKVKKGKDTILYGIIGLVISILAFAIVNFVLGALQS